MGRNFGGGSKHKRRKKFTGVGGRSKEVEYKTTGQDYGLITKALGDAKFECITPDGDVKFASVPGSFRKRVWIRVDDVVLVSIRQFEPNKVDIIHKYSPDHIKQLMNEGKLKMMEDKKDPDEEELSDVVQEGEESDYETVDVDDI